MNASIDIPVYIVAYLAIAVFLTATVARAYIWLKRPEYLRWELFPPPYGGQGAGIGRNVGAENPSAVDPNSEDNASARDPGTGAPNPVLRETLLLSRLRERHPKLWLRALLFHAGVFLLLVCCLLLFAYAVLFYLYPVFFSGIAGDVVRALVQAAGKTGLCLNLLGAAALLHIRIADEHLNRVTSDRDIFNLLFFIGASGCSLMSVALNDPELSAVMFFVYGLVTFRPLPLGFSGFYAIVTPLSAIAMSLLLAYIPLTHMWHGVGKYLACLHPDHGSGNASPVSDAGGVTE